MNVFEGYVSIRVAAQKFGLICKNSTEAGASPCNSDLRVSPERMSTRSQHVKPLPRDHQGEQCQEKRSRLVRIPALGYRVGVILS